VEGGWEEGSKREKEGERREGRGWEEITPLDDNVGCALEREEVVKLHEGRRQGKQTCAHPKVGHLVLKNAARKGEDAMEDLLKLRKWVQEGRKDHEKGGSGDNGELNEQPSSGSKRRSVARGHCL
jgi:hypothetical protein